MPLVLKEHWTLEAHLGGKGILPLLACSGKATLDEAFTVSRELTTNMQIRVLLIDIKKVLKYPHGFAVLFVLREVKGRVKNPSVAQWAQKWAFTVG